MGHRAEFPIIVCHLWSFERQPIIGIRIAKPTIMKFFCKHCDQIVIGKPLSGSQRRQWRYFAEYDGL